MDDMSSYMMCDNIIVYENIISKGFNEIKLNILSEYHTTFIFYDEDISFLIHENHH